MEKSSNLNLPYIMPSQAQKHVTHNEAIRALDALVHLSVKSRTVAAIPTDAEAGERYLVPENGEGDWSQRAGRIAAFRDGAWEYFEPNTGWVVWVEDEEILLVFQVGAWQSVGGASSDTITELQEMVSLGINATADATNRLSLNSDAVLFNHDGGGHQLKLNKAATAETASLVFQTAFEGHAEMGLAGNNDFAIKVSPDGQTWHEALSIDAESGAVAFPNASAITRAAPANLLGDAGRFAGSPSPRSVAIGSYVKPSYLTPYNGSTFSSTKKFIFNNTTYGGAAGDLDPLTDALISKINVASNRRYSSEFHIMTVTCGSGTAYARTINGQAMYSTFTNIVTPIMPGNTMGAYLACTSGAIGISYEPNNFRLFVDGEEVFEDVVFGPQDGWKHVAVVIIGELGSVRDYNFRIIPVMAQTAAVFDMALPYFTANAYVPLPDQLPGIIPNMTGWR